MRAVNMLSVNRRIGIATLPLIFLSFLFSPWTPSESKSQTPVAQACEGNRERAQLTFMVVDKSGAYPLGITKDDFTMIGDDRGDVSVVDLQFQNAVPVDLAILIDASVSQEGAIKVTKACAESLLKGIVNPSTDRAALVSFANEIEVEEALTSDVPKLLAKLESVRVTLPTGYVGGGVVWGRPPAGPSSFPGATSLWDTLAKALERIYGSATPDATRRRAIILFSDGTDTSSHGRLDAAIAKARERKIPIYAVGIAGRDGILDRDALKKMARETGGTTSFPKSPDTLRSAVYDVGKQVRSQYVVSFCRDPIAGPFKVGLRFTNPKFRKSAIVYW